MSTDALERLTFGAKRAEIEAVQKSGINAWVQEQLHPKQEDPALDEVLKTAVLKIQYGASEDWAAVNEYRPLGALQKTTQELWQLTDGQNKMHYAERMRPLNELQVARTVRAVYSKWQIQELMVDFWHNHFNVHAGDASIAAAMPTFERDCIRQHCLGNFAQMLSGVAQSTPMLIFLNNRSSRTGAPNENFARELFELHTLGKQNYLNDLYSKWKQVPGADKGAPKGYIDQDVYEAARAFTGWVIEDGRGLGGNTQLPKTGQFTYLETWHDPYQKRVLAQDFDPFSPAMADGKKVLALLAEHPGTAYHLCEKLCRRFVADTPPNSLVTSSAKVWQDNSKHPEQIARVLAHMFASQEFNQALKSPNGKKLKRPLELAASFVRKLELPFAPSMGLVNEMQNTGQRLYLWPTPDGHPDVTEFWLTTQTMRRRWMFPWALMDNWWATGVISPEHLSKGFALPLDEIALLKHHGQLLVGSMKFNEMWPALAQILNIPNKRILGADNGEFNNLRHTLAYVGMSPAFQWK